MSNYFSEKIVRSSLLLLFAIQLLGLSHANAQAAQPCKVELEYTTYSGEVDSSRLDLYVILPSVNESIDYRFNLSEMFSDDFVSNYCTGDLCAIEYVIKKIIGDKKSRILVEFSNGKFEFLPILSLCHSVELTEVYRIVHMDKDRSYLKELVYDDLGKVSFIEADKFRIHFFLLEGNDCNFDSVYFVTDWLSLHQLLD